VVGIAVLLLGAAAGAYLAFFNKSRTEPIAPGEKSRRITVSKSQVQAGAENTLGTLVEAICKAAPGDTIVIAESPIAEPFIRLSQKKDITIESGLPGGKPVLIEFTSSGGSSFSPMFELTSCESIRLKDLELDGKS